MTKICWSMLERQLVLEEVKRQFIKHPTMSALDLTRMAQKIALPSDRRRELTGTQQVEWIRQEIEKLDQHSTIKDRPISVHELPETPKPDLQSLLVEALTDLIYDIVKEVTTNVKQRLKEDNKNYGSYTEAVDKNLKKIAVYGLMKPQQAEVENHFKGCFEFRFIKDVSQKQLVTAARWADHFIIVTKFVSHDYDAIRHFKNIRFITGAASAIITELENIYVSS